MHEERLKELGNIYGFETDLQRTFRILKKHLDELENLEEKNYNTA